MTEREKYMRRLGAKTWLSLLAAFSLILWAGLASAGPTNVILMISDGMGYNTIQATVYWTGAAAVYEDFPVKYGVSTFSANNTNIPAYDPALAWSEVSYVTAGATDSAAAATAMATGVKNCNGVIGIGVDGRHLTNIVQRAGGLGKAAGVVTTVPWSHATPAGMAAHNASRDNFAAIAIEMLHCNLNVIMGAGNPDYNDDGAATATDDYRYVGGSAAWTALQAGTLNGWTLIQAKTDFEALAANPKPAVTKVVGTVQAHTTTQQARRGNAAAAPGVVPLNANVPSLATMAQGALNVLRQNPKGYFLMVEGGAVDFASHANQLGRMIEEQMDFNAAVQAVVAWVTAQRGWDQTLLIVTADHETGYLWGPGGPFTSVVDHGAGQLPGAAYNSGSHTNSLVPLFAMGAGAENFVRRADKCDPVRGRYVDNIAIFQVMTGAAAATIPAATWLLLCGLVCLGLCRRRTRNRLN
jgi:alkaline phosphatase